MCMLGSATSTGQCHPTCRGVVFKKKLILNDGISFKFHIKGEDHEKEGERREDEKGT